MACSASLSPHSDARQCSSSAALVRRSGSIASSLQQAWRPVRDSLSSPPCSVSRCSHCSDSGRARVFRARGCPGRGQTRDSPWCPAAPRLSGRMTRSGPARARAVPALAITRDGLGGCGGNAAWTGGGLAMASRHGSTGRWMTPDLAVPSRRVALRAPLDAAAVAHDPHPGPGRRTGPGRAFDDQRGGRNR